MTNILLLEPASANKRRSWAETCLAPARPHHPELAEIKARLGEIRDYSLSYQENLVNEVISHLSNRPDMEVILAADAGQAVKKIREISLNLPLVINKSAVILRELAPPLISAGSPIIESYYDEFKSFESECEYWQLPDMPFEPAADSFARPIDLSVLRSRCGRENGVRDCVGLLGVNALSARDGTPVLFQHMTNIGKMVEQARDIILVAGLDKIVKDLEDAVFQTKCMAIFGAGALPLAFRRKTDEAVRWEDMPPGKSPPAAGKAHLILLDNGRSRLRNGPFRDLLACIGCRACTKGCPSMRFFGERTGWSPKEYLYYFISGRNPSLSACLQCQSCAGNCPLEIDLPGMILAARRQKSRKPRPLSDILLSNAEILEGAGHSWSRLSGPAAGNRFLRWLGEKTIGISRERPLPEMGGETFADWYRLRENADNEE